MKFGVSTLVLVNHPITEATGILVDLGFRIIELFCDSPSFHPDRLRDNEIDALLELKEKFGLTYYLHAPIEGLNPADNDPLIYEETLRLYRRSIEVSRRLSCSGVVLHPGHLAHPDASKDEGIRNSIQLMQSVLETAEKNRALLLIENTGTRDTKLFHQVSDFSRFVHFFPLDYVYGVMDVGHAMIQGFDLIEIANRLGERLVHLHLHDNWGTKDGHLPPGKGVIKIKALLEELVSRQWKGTGIIEIHGTEHYERDLRDSMEFLGEGDLLKNAAHASHRSG
jgi:sugar phosphate isomerase/epimerase